MTSGHGTSEKQPFPNNPHEGCTGTSPTALLWREGKRSGRQWWDGVAAQEASPNLRIPGGRGAPREAGARQRSPTAPGSVRAALLPQPYLPHRRSHVSFHMRTGRPQDGNAKARRSRRRGVRASLQTHSAVDQAASTGSFCA